MSNYTKATNFAVKDGLVTTDPAKIIKGIDIDNEFNAIANAISSKADVTSPALLGTPTAPTASNGTNTTQIASTAFVQSAIGVALSGVIVMWSGSVASIPTGWLICDGSNGTPDLRNRFVIGAGSTYSVGGTGGSADAVVVSHTHTATSTDSGHTHTVTGDSFVYQFPYGSALNIRGDYNAVRANTITNPVTSSGTANISTTVASSGVSATNANLPPYYALAFIMKS